MSGVSGDTRIQTKEYGIVRIRTVAGKQLTIWDGNDWTPCEIEHLGSGRLCKVSFIGGQVFECSPTHKFTVEKPEHRIKPVVCACLSHHKANSTHNAHILVPTKFADSDYRYSSAGYRETFSLERKNANNIFIDDLACNDRDKGVVLGRIASNGYYAKGGYASIIRMTVAEHEYSVAPSLLEFSKGWGVTTRVLSPAKGRRQEVTFIECYSTPLRNELCALNLRYSINDALFMDTAMLRGLLRGWFDGDGTVGADNISLTQGIQADFDGLFRDIQKALLFLGIRGRYHHYPDRKYILSITKADSRRFMDMVGFLDDGKATKALGLKGRKEGGKVFGKCLLVDNVEVTNDEVDMFSVCGTERGYYVADGLVCHE